MKAVVDHDWIEIIYNINVGRGVAVATRRGRKACGDISHTS